MSRGGPDIHPTAAARPWQNARDKNHNACEPCALKTLLFQSSLIPFPEDPSTEEIFVWRVELGASQVSSGW